MGQYGRRGESSVEIQRFGKWGPYHALGWGEGEATWSWCRTIPCSDAGEALSSNPVPYIYDIYIYMYIYIYIYIYIY